MNRYLRYLRDLRLTIFFCFAGLALGAPTTVTLTPSANPATFGQSVTLTATIAPSLATGHVTFYQGTTVLGSATLSGGIATLRTILLAAGAAPIRAYYSGDTTYQGSSSPALPQTVNAGQGGAFNTASGSPITVGSSPFSVATGDFNDDGFADLAVANEFSSSLTILLGNGTGQFSPAAGSPVVSVGGPFSVAVGDFNNDGRQDLATANASGGVIVFLGDGTGRFTPVPASPFPAGSGPVFVAVGDLNNDGNADLAVAAQGGNTITVLLGDGTGNFTPAPASPFTVGTSPEWVTVADFNNDGNPDLAVANYGSNSVTILLGNGAGGFSQAPGSPLTTGRPAFAIAAADFNRDGKIDFAVTNYSDNSIIVYLGNGSGGFAETPQSPFLAGPSQITNGQPLISCACRVVAEDFNGDGIQDLAVGNSATSGVTVMLGNGNGGFTIASASPFAVGNNPQAMAVGDFNGDAKVDIAVANLLDNNVDILVNALPQTISFGPIGNQLRSGSPLTIAASSSSGLTVTFSSNTPTFCTVSGNIVSFVNSGGCSITARQAGSATYGPAAPVTQVFTILFNDVISGQYFYDAVNLFAQYGITAGCGNDDYCPGMNATRDQMAVFLVRAAYGSDNFTSSSTPYFTDVQPATFGFRWIQKLYELGITKGCTASTYCPTDSVTRDQMALFLIRLRYGLTLAGNPPQFSYSTTPYFTDVPSTDSAFAWVQRLKEDGITNGCTVVSYCPGSPVIRADMAIFILRGALNQMLPAGTPVVAQITPNTLAAGSSGVFTITGSNTNFVQGTTTLGAIPGMTIGAVTVNSPTSLTVQLTAASNMTAQPYSVVAITGGELAPLPSGLVVQ